ncbi:hypothetical protein GCM10011499_22280 [Pelagibacterium lentulum]|uniref:Uncharacterized protein n=1 Tax=Pelagibacterium lentulum TaxID=2029865 RepID=A0A916VYB4_9HYPH|nr:hypothetical protein GCM10011499_22280 [Pelagibacterium lentulum]
MDGQKYEAEAPELCLPFMFLAVVAYRKTPNRIGRGPDGMMVMIMGQGDSVSGVAGLCLAKPYGRPKRTLSESLCGFAGS